MESFSSNARWMIRRGQRIANRFDRDSPRVVSTLRGPIRDSVGNNTTRRAICAGDRWALVGRGLHEFQSTSYLVHERASSTGGSWSSGPPWRGQYTLRPTSDNTLSGSFEAYCSFVRATTPAIRTWTSSWKVWGLTRPWITSEDRTRVVQSCRKKNVA